MVFSPVVEVSTRLAVIVASAVTSFPSKVTLTAFLASTVPFFGTHIVEAVASKELSGFS